MIYFYTLIANSATKKQIPKSFSSALAQLNDLNALKTNKNTISLKTNLLIGVVDISLSNKIFIKSLNSLHKEDFKLDKPKGAMFKSGDIILASCKKNNKANFIALLYRTKPYAIAMLVKKNDTIKAMELGKRQDTYINLKVSQKSLRVLPHQCIVKIDVSSGNIIEVFGILEDAKIDEYIALETKDTPSFSPTAISSAQSFGNQICKDMYPQRIDLTHLPFCVIDPINAYDHDDAIYFDEERMILYVAIADVSEYVSTGSEIDKEARLRGFSIYFPHKVLPMLPTALSNGICSLQEKIPRLAMVWKITINKDCKVLQSELLESIINVRSNVSYECIELFLQGKKSTLPKIVQKWLKSYVPYVKKLKAIRLKKGYEFLRQEINIDLDENAQICAWSKSKHSMAHSIIEESMLLANVESAKMLESNVPKAIFRIHPKPRESRIKSLRDEMRSMGFNIPSNASIRTLIKCIHSQNHNEYMQDMLDSLIIKSFAKATYGTENIGHFALGFQQYTHFTSPIRRYGDIIIHRILKAILHKDKILNFLLQNLCGITTELNAKEKQIHHIERTFYTYKMLRHAKSLLKAHKSLVCDALVIRDSKAIALDVIPQVNISLIHTYTQFKLVKVHIESVDLLHTAIYGKVIEI